MAELSSACHGFDTKIQALGEFDDLENHRQYLKKTIFINNLNGHRRTPRRGPVNRKISLWMKIVCLPVACGLAYLASGLDQPARTAPTGSSRNIHDACRACIGRDRFLAATMRACRCGGSKAFVLRGNTGAVAGGGGRKYLRVERGCICIVWHVAVCPGSGPGRFCRPGSVVPGAIGVAPGGW